jgi:uncharacterized Ntn-hydrolase superfamily protein
LTYSIIALDPDSEMLAIGVVSGSIAVGSRVPWARFGVGGVATQAYTNPSLGPKILNYIEKGMTAREALMRAIAEDKDRERRQVAVLDWDGEAAVHEGREIPELHGSFVGENCVSVANLVSSTRIPEEMCRSLRRNLDEGLGLAVIEALAVAHELGGDRRGDRSAALLIVGRTEYGRLYDKILDIRVDFSEKDPITDLLKVYEAYMRWW